MSEAPNRSNAHPDIQVVRRTSCSLIASPDHGSLTSLARCANDFASQWLGTRVVGATRWGQRLSASYKDAGGSARDARDLIHKTRAHVLSDVSLSRDHQGASPFIPNTFDNIVMLLAGFHLLPAGPWWAVYTDVRPRDRFSRHMTSAIKLTMMEMTSRRTNNTSGFAPL